MTKTIHPFEVAGLGLAPFRCVGMSEKVYCACQGAPAQAAGTCDYCGTGIRYCFHIKSSDGKEFGVGCDCVRKISREDNRLLSEVERFEALHRREKKETERKARWDARNARLEIELQAQRNRNGGKTDAEVAQVAREAAEAAKAIEMVAANGWLIDVLDGMSGDFVQSMVEKLGRSPLTEFSDRCVSILCDIYAKTTGGRRNSKAYNTAVEEFYAKSGLSA